VSAGIARVTRYAWDVMLCTNPRDEAETRKDAEAIGADLDALDAAREELASLKQQIAWAREYAAEQQSAARSDGGFQDWGHILDILPATSESTCAQDEATVEPSRRHP
jgi:hypothetical protein